jgi:hypothetical protein
MKKIDGNSSAYPTRSEIDGCAITTGGMTIRAQMAAMICAGLAGNSDMTSRAKDDKEGVTWFSKLAIKQADALIAELNNTDETTKCQEQN